MSLSLRTRWLAVAICAVALVFLGAALQEQEPPLPFITTPDGTTLTVVDAVCDTEMYELFAQHAQASESKQIPLNMVSKNDLRMTVVHDCQRLVTNRTLGPLVSVLASTQKIQEPNFRDGSVVAEIVNYSRETYAHLGIQPGVSCLWIEGDTRDPTGTTWVAAIRRPDSGHCLQPFTGSPRSSELLVVKRYTYGDTVYPSTARWMFDHQNATQFIGIRCGYGWCELGKPGFQSRTRVTDKDSVPGWFDEQYLSYIPKRPGSLMLSNIYGRIAPVRPLNTAPLGIGLGSREVARLDLRGEDPPAWGVYREKLPLTMTSSTRGRAVLRVRRVIAPPGAMIPVAGGAFRIPTGPLFVRQVAGVGSNDWINPKFNDHNEHAGLGAVRWAWNELDEGTWFWCDGGCCRNDDFCPSGVCN